VPQAFREGSSVNTIPITEYRRVKMKKSKDSKILVVVGWIVVAVMIIAAVVLTAYGVTGIWIWEIWGP